MPPNQSRCALPPRPRSRAPSPRASLKIVESTPPPAPLPPSQALDTLHLPRSRATSLHLPLTPNIPLVLSSFFPNLRLSTPRPLLLSYPVTLSVTPRSRTAFSAHHSPLPIQAAESRRTACRRPCRARHYKCGALAECSRLSPPPSPSSHPRLIAPAPAFNTFTPLQLASAISHFFSPYQPDRTASPPLPSAPPQLAPLLPARPRLNVASFPASPLRSASRRLSLKSLLPLALVAFSPAPACCPPATHLFAATTFRLPRCRHQPPHSPHCCSPTRSCSNQRHIAAAIWHRPQPPTPTPTPPPQAPPRRYSPSLPTPPSSPHTLLFFNTTSSPPHHPHPFPLPPLPAQPHAPKQIVMANVHHLRNNTNGAQNVTLPPTAPTIIPGRGMPRYPLANCTGAMVMVVKAAMNSRAEKGQYWLHRASASASGTDSFDMATLLPAVPTPWLGKHTPAQLRELYAAALRRELSVFDLPDTAPTLDAVVDHVLDNTGVSRSAIVLACIYVDRLTVAAPHLFVTESNVQRLFGVAFMLAAKWHEDYNYSSVQFADLFGMSLQLLNELESAFTAAIDFNLFVTTEQFHDAQLALMTEALDSMSGLNVFQTLVKARVADVPKAFDATKTWGKFPDVGTPATLWSMAAGLACDTEGHDDGLEDEHEIESLEFSTLERSPCERKGRKVVAQLARAQISHDFPRVSAESFVTELQRGFAEDGIFRYAKLQLVARYQELDDLVMPPLERVDSPGPRLVPSPKPSPPPVTEEGGSLCPPGGLVTSTLTVLPVHTNHAPAGGSSIARATRPRRCNTSRFADLFALRPSRVTAAHTESYNPSGIWSTSHFMDFCPIRSW